MGDDLQGIRLHGPIELASAEMECWKCHQTTQVHALLAADVEEFEPGEEPYRTEQPTFVHGLAEDALPAAIMAALQAAAPNYRPRFSRTVGATAWANACVHCDVLQGAFHVHHEPDGPFFGGVEDFTGTRVPLSEHGFDVDEAGYSG